MRAGNLQPVHNQRLWCHLATRQSVSSISFQNWVFVGRLRLPWLVASGRPGTRLSPRTRDNIPPSPTPTRGLFIKTRAMIEKLIMRLHLYVFPPNNNQNQQYFIVYLLNFDNFTNQSHFFIYNFFYYQNILNLSVLVNFKSSSIVRLKTNAKKTPAPLRKCQTS